jgi:SAM-dependent methyltransferase
LPFDSGSYQVVISNSIVHHIPEPREVLAEAVRVTAMGGLLFHRDLCRPDTEQELDRIVETYAGGANAYQRRLFADSLHAALTVEEVRRIVAEFGFAPETVYKSSDRHWTWIATKI